jgi:hypothetical protein
MLMDGRASEPEMWPDPFALRADEEGVAMEVEPGHMVLYNSTQKGREAAIVAGGA